MDTHANIAIEWESSAYYLQYLPSREQVNTSMNFPIGVILFFQDVENHPSVKPPRSWNNTGSNIDDPTMLITLEDCLQSFINWENLDSKEMFNCKRCKQLQPAEKKLDIWKLPPCLVSEFP